MLKFVVFFFFKKKTKKKTAVLITQQVCMRVFFPLMYLLLSLFTDVEWCWLSNYHTCEDEPIKSNLAAERRIRKLHCQLKDDLKNENRNEQ